MPVPESDRRARRRGLALATAGVIIISPDSAIIRSVGTSVWTTVAWRGFFVALGTMALLAIGRVSLARSLVRPTWHQFIGGILFGAASVAFVSSLYRTDAATVLVIIAAGPLIAAVLGLIVLGERPPARTWLAAAGVVVGLSVILGWSVVLGDLDGSLLALAGATCFAGFLTVSRMVRPAGMMPAIAIGGFVAAVVGVASGAHLAIGMDDVILLGCLGCLIIPVSLALLTRSTHRIAAPEVSLITLLETILGPLWVWAVIGEPPGLRPLLGGALIVAAVAAHSVAAVRAAADGTAPGAARADLGRA